MDVDGGGVVFRVEPGAGDETFSGSGIGDGDARRRGGGSTTSGDSGLGAMSGAVSSSFASSSAPSVPKDPNGPSFSKPVKLCLLRTASLRACEKMSSSLFPLPNSFDEASESGLDDGAIDAVELGCGVVNKGEADRLDRALVFGETGVLWLGIRCGKPFGLVGVCGREGVLEESGSSAALVPASPPESGSGRIRWEEEIVGSAALFRKTMQHLAGTNDQYHLYSFGRPRYSV